jgi:flagellar motor switch/type III secretory pathway protein FliN
MCERLCCRDSTFHAQHKQAGKLVDIVIEQRRVGKGNGAKVG